ncbi:MAG: FkbM family methyltransferase [Caldimonas sp.]
MKRLLAHIGWVKRWLVRLRLYRPVRSLYRQIANREGLRQLKAQQAVYGAFVKPGDLCFDVGANRGVKSEALLRVGGRVVAVEPQPECVAELRERLDHFRGFQCLESAVGAEVGTATLHIADCDVLSSVRPDWFGMEGRWASSIRVPMTTLDALIAAYGEPRYCKIDVEGLELDVLRGLTRRLPYLSFEFHVSPALNPVTVACLRRLAELGPYEANVSCREAPALTGDWLPADRFIEHFETRIATDPDFDYGEIYVRFAGGR